MAVIYGTNRRDDLHGTAGADTIYGWDRANGPGDFGPASDGDALFAVDGDLLRGGAGNDQLHWTGSQNRLFGGPGDDVLFNEISKPNQVGSLVDGGAGIDTYLNKRQHLLSMVVNVADLQAGAVLPDGTRVVGIERVHLFGSAQDDRITGGDLGDTVLGWEGNDLLQGGGGDDVLWGGAGRDTVRGGDGNDSITLDGLGADLVEGGLGIDLLIYDAGQRVARNVTLDLSQSMILPDGSTATGFERLFYTGTHGVDLITGGELGDFLDGGDEGNDVLLGRGGNDYLRGSSYVDQTRGFAGRITLHGGDGDDTLTGAMLQGSVANGGAGIDLLDVDYHRSLSGLRLVVADLAGTYTDPFGAVFKGIERVRLLATRWDDSLTGGAYDDTLNGQDGADLLSGGAGNDELIGGHGRDTLYGGAGDDLLTDADGANVMFGADGNDVLVLSHLGHGKQFLYGGNGDDSLTGGMLADVLNGGAGSDVLRGRSGADDFTFNAAPVAGEVDRLEDFGRGADRLVLRASAFAGLAAGGLAAADFVLGAVAGDASDRILYDRATGALRYDADGTGDGTAVQFAALVAGTDLVVGDFLIV